ncbi:MAG: hypothetical protein ACI4NX_06090, partial [Megasphaera elsdenii]|uniref:hypothetical protein n=1 Tax=Megasphaera elsdenii TaxID=907 RepID=UPI003F0B1DC0
MAAIPYIAQSLWTLQMIARQAILQNPSISELWAYQLLKKCSTFCPFSKGITSVKNNIVYILCKDILYTLC